MSNEPVPGEVGAGEGPPTPDARCPPAAPGVPGRPERRAGAAWTATAPSPRQQGALAGPGRPGRIPARRARRRTRTCTCHRHPSGRLAGGGRAGADGGRCSAPRASPARGRTHLTNPPRPLPPLRDARRASRSAPRSSEKHRRMAGRRRYTPPGRAHCAGSRRGSADCACAGSRARSPRQPGPTEEGGAGGGAGRGRRGAGVEPAGPTRFRAPWLLAGLFAGAGAGGGGPRCLCGRFP